jgi:hypothetical protein
VFKYSQRCRGELSVVSISRRTAKWGSRLRGAHHVDPRVPEQTLPGALELPRGQVWAVQKIAS